ncbi:DUF1002 domain-containing protein [Hutsoniella sourekii]|uniref:DUF1002 domain-containing protein n=1 Tax=Hutsoniella sourekii TaxID=87650 RepID=UPI0004899B39|nr:DUF1002 domain-containing protein [Hutsoniella sourekii]
MHCPNCQHPIAINDQYCGHCGYPIGPDLQKHSLESANESGRISRSQRFKRQPRRGCLSVVKRLIQILVVLLLCLLAYFYLRANVDLNAWQEVLPSQLLPQENSSSSPDKQVKVEHLAIGATLTKSERLETLRLLGAEDFPQDQVVEVDGPMVDRYLHDGSTSKTRVFSSVAIIPLAADSGVQVEVVTPNKITRVSDLTYRNAAINSGVRDKLIRVASLHEVTGEGALVGLYAWLDQAGIGDQEAYQNTNDQVNLVIRIQEETGLPQIRINELFINLRRRVIEQVEEKGNLDKETARVIVTQELDRMTIQVSQDLLDDLIIFILDFSKVIANDNEGAIDEMDRLDQELDQAGRKDLIDMRQKALETLKDSGHAGHPQRFLSEEEAIRILGELEAAALSGQVVYTPGQLIVGDFFPDGYLMPMGSQITLAVYLEALVEFYQVEVDRDQYPYSLNWHELPQTADLYRQDSRQPDKVYFDRANRELIYPEKGHRNISGSKSVKLYHQDTQEIQVYAAEEDQLNTIKVNSRLTYEDPDNPSAYGYEQVYVYRKRDGRLAMAVPAKYDKPSDKDRYIELVEKPSQESGQEVAPGREEEESSSGDEVSESSDLLALDNNSLYQGNWIDILQQLPENPDYSLLNSSTLVEAAQELQNRPACPKVIQAMIDKLIGAIKDDSYASISVNKIYMHTFLIPEFYSLDGEQTQLVNYFRTLLYLFAVSETNGSNITNDQSIKESWIQGYRNGETIFNGDPDMAEAARQIARVSGTSPYFIQNNYLTYSDGIYLMTPMTAVYSGNFPWNETYDPSTGQVAKLFGITGESTFYTPETSFSFEREYDFVDE